ncbi:MAG: type IX secretion system plug protein domain-containing protein, partial [Candidatus Kapaibacterium sp.]
MKSTPIQSRRRIRSIPALLATAWILMPWGATHLVAREETPEDAAVVRAVRVFGGSNETLPPVLLAQRRSPDVRPAYGEDRLTLEIDVQAPVPPAYSIRFVHCRADWSEDNNMFLSDIAFMQTSRIDWQLAPPGCTYYTYRGRVVFPNESVRIPYGGNWKVRITEFGSDEKTYAEARFFAVDAAAHCSMNILSDLYEPRLRASPAALNIETTVTAPALLSDLQMRSAVFYRLNRWNEPMPASAAGLTLPTFRSTSPLSFVSGVITAGKRFLVQQVPAENEYRVLDCTNLAQFPRVTSPIRLPFYDIRRNGSFVWRAHNGGMVTTGVPMMYDDYVPVEFVLDPENRPSREDVFVLGSFNNWTPSRAWSMVYNDSTRLYTARGWVRRAVHDYAYATGRINADSYACEDISFEECEGNTVGAGHTFVCFV